MPVRGDIRSMSQKSEIHNAWLENQQAKAIATALSGAGGAAGTNAGFMQGFGDAYGNSLARFSDIGNAMSQAMKQGGNTVMFKDQFDQSETVANRKLKEKLGMGGIDAQNRSTDAQTNIANMQYGKDGSEDRSLANKLAAINATNSNALDIANINSSTQLGIAGKQFDAGNEETRMLNEFWKTRPELMERHFAQGAGALNLPTAQEQQVARPSMIQQEQMRQKPVKKMTFDDTARREDLYNLSSNVFLPKSSLANQALALPSTIIGGGLKSLYDLTLRPANDLLYNAGRELVRSR